MTISGFFGSACSTWRNPRTTCGSNQRGVLSSSAPKKPLAASSGNGRDRFPVNRLVVPLDEVVEGIQREPTAFGKRL
jgi:hypothetical protein